MFSSLIQEARELVETVSSAKKAERYKIRTQRTDTRHGDEADPFSKGAKDHYMKAGRYSDPLARMALPSDTERLFKKFARKQQSSMGGRRTMRRTVSGGRTSKAQPWHKTDNPRNPATANDIMRTDRVGYFHQTPHQKLQDKRRGAFPHPNSAAKAQKSLPAPKLPGK